MIAVIGAGAMGAALAVQMARTNGAATLLGTTFDQTTVDAVRSGKEHPALRIDLPGTVDTCGYDEWDEQLARADVIVVGVSSAGIAAVAEDAAKRAPDEANWVIATKGWDERSLGSPSEIVTSIVGERVAVLAGPALALELAVGAPTAFVCASKQEQIGQVVKESLESGPVSVSLTDDVPGAETASAYKNVVAIVVGMCQGLGEKSSHDYANARSAIFAKGLTDMEALALARGGSSQTIYGLAGAGDLYVTCLGGRNGNFGRLLGSGLSADEAKSKIGSTVEGEANTAVALELAQRAGVKIPTAEAVDAVLTGRLSPEDAVGELLR